MEVNNPEEQYLEFRKWWRYGAEYCTDPIVENTYLRKISEMGEIAVPFLMKDITMRPSFIAKAVYLILKVPLPADFNNDVKEFCRNTLELCKSRGYNPAA